MPIAELAGLFGRRRTLGMVLARMRCAGGCGGPVSLAWLTTGPALNARIRPRRIALRGPEAR